MSSSPFRILVLCTGNSARSILAEALLNHLGRGKVIAVSAGSHPNGRVNPFAIETLQRMNVPIGHPRSKSWDEFAGEGAAPIDFIITVCDNAAGESCPIWPGHPITAHWGVPDPAAVTGDDEQKRRAFNDAYAALKRRVDLFLALPLDKLDRAALSARMRAIGQL